MYFGARLLPTGVTILRVVTLFLVKVSNLLSHAFYTGPAQIKMFTSLPV